MTGTLRSGSGGAEEWDHSRPSVVEDLGGHKKVETVPTGEEVEVFELRMGKSPGNSLR